jgi:hypothetical protein
VHTAFLELAFRFFFQSVLHLLLQDLIVLALYLVILDSFAFALYSFRHGLGILLLEEGGPLVDAVFGYLFQLLADGVHASGSHVRVVFLWVYVRSCMYLISFCSSSLFHLLCCTCTSFSTCSTCPIASCTLFAPSASLSYVFILFEGVFVVAFILFVLALVHQYLQWLCLLNLVFILFCCCCME